MRRKVLVCGSRNWADGSPERYRALKDRLSQQDVLSAIVIHGNAKGADRMAEAVCVENNVHTAKVEPRWRGFGKEAGYLRNCAMLDLQPDLVIAFTTGSRGTQLTINEARKRGIPVEIHGTELAEGLDEAPWLEGGSIER